MWTCKNRDITQSHAPYSLTNRGLSIKLMTIPFAIDTYLVRLDCVDELLPAGDGPADAYRLGNFLRRLCGDDQYARITHEGNFLLQVRASTWDHNPSRPLQSTRPVRLVDINVQRQFNELNTDSYKDRVSGSRLAEHDFLERSSLGKDRFKVFGWGWDPAQRIISMQPGDFGSAGVLDFSKQGYKIKIIQLGFDFEYNPAYFVATSGGASKNARTMGRKAFTTESLEAQCTNEEQAQFPGSHKRISFDTTAWSEVHYGNAFQLKSHKRL